MTGWAEPRPEAIAWYWDSAYVATRGALLDVVARYPFTRVLELGCHCGPVWRRLRERFGPDFTYHGVDVNALAIAAGQRYAASDPHTFFTVRDIRDGLDFPDQSVDLVVSSSCLQHLTPEEVGPVLVEARRVATTAVIVQEDYGTGEHIDGRGWAHAYPEWVVRC